jgi:hypothetical protein
VAKGSKFNPAVKVASGAVFDKEGKPKPAVHKAINKAIDVQRPLVLANLTRLRRKYPNASVAQLNAKLERDYLTAVTGTGAAVGASAAVPGLGTAASLGLSAAATVAFLEATALYAQSVAELHGIQTDDPERARTMVMAIMLGEEGGALVSALAGQSAGKGQTANQYWGNLLGKSLPSNAVGMIGNAVRKKFMRIMLAKQGSAMLGRAIPFGIGAAVGGAGNHVMGRSVIRSAREAFGPLPDVIPGTLANELERSARESPQGPDRPAGSDQ